MSSACLAWHPKTHLFSQKDSRDLLRACSISCLYVEDYQVFFHLQNFLTIELSLIQNQERKWGIFVIGLVAQSRKAAWQLFRRLSDVHNHVLLIVQELGTWLSDSGCFRPDVRSRGSGPAWLPYYFVRVCTAQACLTLELSIVLSIGHNCYECSIPLQNYSQILYRVR